MDRELLHVYCKTDADFRRIQSHLDTNTIAYTILTPVEQRPRKSVIRGIPPYAELQLIIDALKGYNFITNRTSMMKSRKTGNPVPLYVVNVLPMAKYEEIYNVFEIFYIRLVIERYKGTNIVKQCYRYQNVGHASEIGRLQPKCAKCAGIPLNPECPQIVKLHINAPVSPVCTRQHTAVALRPHKNIKKQSDSQKTLKDKHKAFPT